MRSTETVTNAQTYLIWLADRRGIELPSDVRGDQSGLYVIRGPEGARRREDVLKMPGYGASSAVTVDFLNETGEVVRSSRIGAKPNGHLAQTAAQVREMTGPVAKVKPAPRAFYPGEGLLPEGVTVSPPKLAPRDALRMTPAEMRAYLAACRPMNADGSPYLEPAAEPVEAIDWQAVAEMPAPIAPPIVAPLADAPAAPVSLAKPARTLADRAPGHYAAGRAAHGRGEPCELPSYFTRASDNSRAWLEGWAAAAREALEVQAPAAVTPSAAADGMGEAIAYASAALALDGAAAAPAIWQTFVGLAAGLPILNAADGWARTQGRQRDRKARNRGKLIIGTHAIDAMREAFAGLLADAPPIAPVAAAPAPVEPIAPPPAPIEPEAPAPVPGDALAAVTADLAALAARVAALQAGAADDRRPARLRIARAYLRMRAERAAMRRTLENAREAVARADQRASETVEHVHAARAVARTLRDKRSRTAERLAHTRDQLTRSRQAHALTGGALDIANEVNASLRRDLDRLQPLAAALQALMPAAPTPSVPVLVASNGRDLRAA